MENASKALIIAGGVLLAIVVLSIGIALIGTIGSVADSYVLQQSSIELQKYNSYFEPYVGREDITIQEIVTLINIAKQKAQGTQIWIGTKNVTNYSETQINDLLSDPDNILVYIENTASIDGYDVENTYSYVSINYDNSGKVIEIKFEKN